HTRPLSAPARLARFLQMKAQNLVWTQTAPRHDNCPTTRVARVQRAVCHASTALRGHDTIGRFHATQMPRAWHTTTMSADSRRRTTMTRGLPRLLIACFLGLGLVAFSRRPAESQEKPSPLDQPLAI